jgi:tetratricopeptide (TPR) repeat protein
MQLVTGHPVEALSAFDRAESAGCTDPDVKYCRGLIYFQQSRFDMAEKSADFILKNTPDHIPALHLKAKALDSVGRLKEAVDCYNTILKLTDSEYDTNQQADE